MRRYIPKAGLLNHRVFLALALAVLLLGGSGETTVQSGNTTLTGIVLDAISASEGIETPIVGATVSILDTGVSTTTDSSGSFVLENIPQGSRVIFIDTTTSDLAPDGTPYASFTGWIPLNQGQVNNFETPFYLTRIDQDSITRVKPSKTTVVENPNLGVTLTIPPKSAVTADGKLYRGEISIALIPQGFPPMPPPKEFGFGLMVTVQPAGITFTEPALITFPNIDNLPPGSQVNIMGPDINTGKFIVIGTGQVSQDREFIETISGGVVRTANCTGPMPPGPGGGPPIQDPPPCDDCCPLPIGSTTTLAGGNLSEEHSLVSYKSLNQDRSLTLEYNSTFADPGPVIQNQVDLTGTTIPNTVSMNLNVTGVDMGTLYTDPNNGLKIDRQLVQAIQFDASSMPTGAYPYEVTVSNNFTATTASTTLLPIFKSRELLINNLRDSAFGSGWSMEVLSRLYVQQDGSALIDEGNGGLLHFKSRVSTLTPPIASGAQSGSALKFDGFNDFIYFQNNSGNIMKVLPLTVEAWVRPEVKSVDPNAGPNQIAKHSSVVNNITVPSGTRDRGHGIGVDIFAAGVGPNITVTRIISPTTTGTERRFITGANIFPNEWHHVAVVYANGNDKVYLDGELIDDSSYNQGSLTAGYYRLAIGRIVHCCVLAGQTRFTHYNGDIDEIRIWQAARTQQEIQNTMSVQLTGSEPGLVFYANFDEGQGQVLNDLTGRENGTLGFYGDRSDNGDPIWMTYTEFNRDTDGDFITPTGDYSLLFQNPGGSFTRKMKDGTVINFNAQGLQTSVVDRNGNTTAYQYDGQGRLISITDPVGLVTTLTYNGSRISSVTDPAGRTTTFLHDGAGNLIKITDPDGTFRQFSYDSNHKMTSQTSKRGHVTTYQYNFAGRNISATRPDGSVVTLSPQWISALIDPATGLGTQTNPAPVVRTDQVKASYTDGNGKTTAYKLNEFGAIIQTTDALGRITDTTRDANNKVIQSKDPRGNITDMIYDSKGNLLTSTQQSIGATNYFHLYHRRVQSSYNHQGPQEQHYNFQLR